MVVPTPLPFRWVAGAVRFAVVVWSVRDGSVAVCCGGVLVVWFARKGFFVAWCGDVCVVRFVGERFGAVWIAVV